MLTQLGDFLAFGLSQCEIKRVVADSLFYTRPSPPEQEVIAMSRQDQLIRFLQDELGIPTAAIQLALSHPEHALGVLPMILWQYGLVTLNQLDQIFDWMEQGYVA